MKKASKDQIVALEVRLLEAMKNSDIDALDELLHDDLLFVIPTGQTVTKQMDLANLQSGNLKIEEISSSEQEIRVIHDDAIVSVVISLKGNYLGNPIAGQFKYIRTWKLFNGSWKVIGGAGIQM